MLGLLTTVPTRFYVYDEEEIDQPSRGCCHPKLGYFPREAGAEQLVYDSLKAHPLRTSNPEQADLFVIPLGLLGIQWGSGNDPNRQNAVYNKAFQTLLASPWFQKNQGNDHVLVSTHWSYFDFEQKRGNVDAFQADPMHRYYNAIWNVTWAGGVDRRGIETLYQSGQHPDYQNSFQYGRFQMSRSVFSVGLLPGVGLPYLEATYEKFVKSQFFLFYHTRKEPCWTPHSTEFRKAPLKKEVVENLPKSSIGYGMDPDPWLKEFTTSQFCLVVRGDNPQTHAMNRAVKVGCIPVVVSDAFSEYGPTLRSSITIQDYAIFIPEAAFLENPLRELKKLESLSDQVIREKLDALAWAQRIILPDHPQSLFVPAFIRETLHAQTLRRQAKTLEEYTNWHNL